MPIRRFMRFMLLAAVAFVPALVVPISGGDRKASAKPVVIEGRLAGSDPLDKVQDKSYAKTHAIKLEAGKYYKFHVQSQALTPILRLATASGTPLVMAESADKESGANLIYQPLVTGTYHAIVTTAEPKQTGAYTLKIGAPTRTEVLLYRASKLEDLSTAAQKEVAAQYVKYLAARKDKLEGRDLELAFAVGESQEAVSAVQAANTYNGLAAALSGAKDAKIARIGRMFAGAARRMNLPGKHLDLKATMQDGKPLDWKSYRGKVVLVDFWATWCPPCVRELPNVKKMYDSYHKRGFEVVAISLDYTREKLDKFLEREKLPWISVLDEERGNAIAEQYGVFSIPLPILVDRDGRVISMNARGENLEKLLQKHLPESK